MRSRGSVARFFKEHGFDGQPGPRMNQDKIHRHVAKSLSHNAFGGIVIDSQLHEGSQGNFRQQQEVIANGQEQEVEHRNLRAVHE